MSRRLRIDPLLIAGLLALSMPGAAQILPTTAAPPGPRTGMIVGQVIDASTGEPVSEAIVTLGMPRYAGNSTTPAGRVMADGEGRFFFTELPPGEFYVGATKDGYAQGSYGQHRAWGPGQLLSLANGERRADVSLRLWKYGVIAGTVVDEAGEPVVGVGVRALIRNVIGGRTRYGNVEVIPELVPAATTDDRGMFRLSQLQPGTYVVVVPSTQATVPLNVMEGQDAGLRSDLFFSGVPEISPLGHPRTQQVGDLALMTSNRMLIPPPPTPDGRMQAYRTTYFPTATTASAASPITVQAGEERADITISLRVGPAVRVSGRLVTPDGSAPPRTIIRLVGDAMSDVVTSTSGGGFETVTAVPDASGRFTLLGVPPGDYVLTHANRFLSRNLRQGLPAYWVSQPVTVGSENVSNLTVALRPALRVEGRVHFRGGTGPQAPSPLRVLVVFETPSGEPGQFAVEGTGDTLTFSGVAAGGQYIARPVESSGWFVQSVTLDGKDIMDRAFDLQADATSLVVTYTNRPSRVSGTVTDERGAARATAMVLAFPVDPQRWSGYGVTPRILKNVPTTRSGGYTFEHLPPGDYYVIAIEAAESGGWQDPATLEALAGRATRLSVSATDSLKTLDLPLRTIQ